MILLTDDQIEMLAERIAAKLKREEKKTYTLKEAGEALNLHPRTVRRMKDDGLLRTIPGTSRCIFPAAEIEKLLTHGHKR